MQAEEVLAALRLPATTSVEFEPLGEASTAPCGVHFKLPGGDERRALLRPAADPEFGANHLAVMEALTGVAFPFAPRLLGIAGDTAIEEDADGVTALAVVIEAASLHAAVEALAALHALPTREGLRWGSPAAEVLPGIDLPLHRLGFAAHEREAAHAPLQALHSTLIESPFGFVHGNATAANVRFTAGSVKLVDFAAAGFGPQLADVAAFLLTCGANPDGRRELAEAYARARSLDVLRTVDEVDGAGLLWGLRQLLALPRTLIEAYGDEAAVDAITTTAARIERGLREPTGDLPAAANLRAALWPR